MGRKVHVRLRPVARGINLPTVLKTTILPGDFSERLFIATQAGEIYYLVNGNLRPFLDLRSRVIKLGRKGGYDERGLLGLAFHPEFYYNGLFYLHYSLAGTQGPGAPADSFKPNPCDPKSLRLQWTNRERFYDHFDTVEEWLLPLNGQPRKRRTLLTLRRPFFNHNGVNSLNFSPETGKLVLTTGDGGSGYDPYNLSQDDREIAGKILEIDVARQVFVANPPAVSRFEELPAALRDTITVIAKGVRNIPGIAYQRAYDRYIKYAGNVGQDLVESIFSFDSYQPQINFGWRGWEGGFPTSLPKSCSSNPPMSEKIIAYYDEAVKLSECRLQPLFSYFHQDSRPDSFAGTALTGVQPYMGNAIPALSGSVVFTDLARKQPARSAARGVLAYVRAWPDCPDWGIIEPADLFGGQDAYYVSLGTNLDQTRLFLGAYGSLKTSDWHKGSVFEIVP